MPLGQPNRPVKRDPALEPAVGEVLTAAAGFPDALIWLVPVVAEPVDDARQGHPAGVRGLKAEVVAGHEGV